MGYQMQTELFKDFQKEQRVLMRIDVAFWLIYAEAARSVLSIRTLDELLVVLSFGCIVNEEQVDEPPNAAATARE